MARPAVIVALPPTESIPVSTELLAAGFEVFEVDEPRQLESAPRRPSRRGPRHPRRRDRRGGIRAPIEAALADAGRPIATLTVVSPRAFERLASQIHGESENEYFTRPYSADSIRWRVEAMCIRRETVDDGSGPILQGGDIGIGGWNGRATTIAVFNPKGGVGKTTVATNLASALQSRKGKSVLLDRRRHRDRSRDDVARHRRRPDGRRQLARRGRRRTEREPLRDRLVACVRHEGRRPDRLAAPHRRPRSGPDGRRHRRGPRPRRRHRRSTCTRPTARSTRRSSRRRTGSSSR